MAMPTKTNSTPLVVMVSGPTASGKSHLAVSLATQLSTEIVGADSRQIYRELPIGSGVLPLEERLSVPHHLVGHRSVLESYDVTQYEQEALKMLDDVLRRCGIAFVCGGTGLYLRVLERGLDAMPVVPDEVRKKVLEKLQEEGVAALAAQVLALDPGLASVLDVHNPRRVTRALELLWVGAKPSTLRTGSGVQRPFRVMRLGLHPNREVLYENINKRVLQMVQQGLGAEADALFDYRHLPALQTLGYTEWYAHREGKLGEAEAIHLIQQNTRRYAKRQLTWFRREPETHWLSEPNADEALKRIHNIL
jgi:tRNA dimethylallyltransferase